MLGYVKLKFKESLTIISELSFSLIWAGGGGGNLKCHISVLKQYLDSEHSDRSK